MVSLEQFIYVVPMLALAASISYYAMVLRNQNKTRQAQLLMGLYETYRNPDFAQAWGEVINQEYTDFDDYWSKYGADTNRDAWTKWQSVARAFHGMGVLLRRDMVEIDLVEELLANIVFISWIKMGPVVLGFREMTKIREEGKGQSKKYPQMSGFEYLYNELRKRETRTNP